MPVKPRPAPRDEPDADSSWTHIDELIWLVRDDDALDARRTRVLGAGLTDWDVEAPMDGQARATLEHEQEMLVSLVRNAPLRRRPTTVWLASRRTFAKALRAIRDQED